MSHPNILFIMTDQHRWDYMGYMDLPVMQGLTPNFDRLAAEGTAFTRCYSVNPLCMPARNAIHTGLYTFQSGQIDNVGDWPMDLPTFTQGLQRLGYHTVLTGKIHAHEAVGFDIDLTDERWDAEVRGLGFDEVVQVSGKTMAFFTDDAYTHHLREKGLLYAYRENIVARTEGKDPWGASVLPEEEFIDNFIGRKAVEWLERYDGEEPFFHMVSFCSPHPCFDAHASALGRVDAGKIALPDGAGARHRGMIANYAAQIGIVDENVGRILRVLEERGWLEETMIVYTADHGEMLGDEGKSGKCWWEDGSTRVPMLVRYKPWCEGGKVVDGLVSCHDVAATVLDCASGGQDVREFLPRCSAVSVRPLVTGEGDAVREVVYSENGGQFCPPWRMVGDGEFKYVYMMDTGEEMVLDGEDRRVEGDVAEEVMRRLRLEMVKIHLEHPAPKRGRSACSPGVPHAITRERLERTHPDE